jgi:hypothetical protein
MAMQTDVLASQVRTDDGVLNNQAGNAIGPARVKGVYIVPSGTAGSVVFKDGSTSGGTTVLTVNTVASATQPTYFLIPGEGIRFTSGIYVDVTSIGSVMVFYG